MRAGIYAIRNFQTDKIYIGQAVNISKRWKNHRIELRLNRHRNRYLQSAYNKYGSVNLVFYIMEYCNVASLDEREQFYMDLYNSYDREDGYNLSPTAGGSCTGFKHSEETKAEWSKNRIGKKRSEEGRAGLRKAWETRRANGYTVSDETRQKQSEVRRIKNRKHTVEFKEAMSKRLTGNTINAGRKQSPVAIELRRKANTGKTRTEEQCKNISEGLMGHDVSDEARLRMSIAAKVRHAREARLRFKALMFID